MSSLESMIQEAESQTNDVATPLNPPEAADSEQSNQESSSPLQVGVIPSSSAASSSASHSSTTGTNTSTSTRVVEPVLKTTKSNKPTESKRVSFSQPEDKDNIFHPTPKGKKATRSATFGKADPLRDLGLFLAIVAFLYYVATSLEGFGKPDNGELVTESRGSLSRFRQMRKALSKMLQHEWQQNPPRLDCDLFLTKSTIPHTGFGLLAGTNYTQGQEIMILANPSLLVEWEGSKRFWITPQSLLFKHHPTLPNVETSDLLWTTVEPTSENAHPKIVLKATKPIAVGEELILSYEQHLHSQLPEWFDQSIPRLEDYLEADFLIQEARNIFRDPKGPRGRNVDKQQQSGIVGQALRMVQHVVARYRPATAKLMPIALQALSSYRGRADGVTSLYLGLHNQSISILTRYGLCFSDINYTATNHALVTRNITKGKRVHPVPLLVRLKVERDSPHECNSKDNLSGSTASCKDRQHLCWSRPEVLVEFCPLEPLTNIEVVDAGTDEVTVEIQWSSWTEAAKAMELDLSVFQDKIGRQEAMFLWDIVATRDLNYGDKLTIGLERDGNTGDWMVPKELISSKWLQQ